MSVRELLGCLAGIEETVLLYKGERGRPRARHMLTEMDTTQAKLYDFFGLDAYAPRRRLGTTAKWSRFINLPGRTVYGREEVRKLALVIVSSDDHWQAGFPRIPAVGGTLVPVTPLFSRAVCQRFGQRHHSGLCKEPTIPSRTSRYRCQCTC
jgi:hypothetical protein